ncbi:shufflon system plasmid conjugative transfer pilus tip adhesin PilV [Actimicrobium sp. CCI2.3]|nr:shufflon system plasmid conjugative transfer pilus tip adhesin PilV [Actimicrobium sp. CCI2.3]
MLLGLTTILDSSLQDTKGQQTAQYQTLFSDAAKRYLDDKYPTLLTNISTVGDTISVSVGTLKGGAYLPASFTATNAYQQTPCMLVRKSSLAQLEVLLVTEGGTEISDADIGYVAANAGTGGGTITRDPASGKLIARGAYGSWTLNNSTGAPKLSDFLTAKCSAYQAGNGHLATALFYGAGPSTADFLYRHNIGNSAYNTMSEPIGMADQALKLANSDCDATPALAMEQGTGKMLLCDLNTRKWTEPLANSSSWKAPVDSLTNLTSLITPPVLGDVYVVRDTGIAWVMGTYGWYRLGEDNTGSIDIPGFLTVRNDVTVDRDVTIWQDVTAHKFVHTGTGQAPNTPTPPEF